MLRRGVRQHYSKILGAECVGPKANGQMKRDGHIHFGKHNRYYRQRSMGVPAWHQKSAKDLGHHAADDVKSGRVNDVRYVSRQLPDGRLPYGVADAPSLDGNVFIQNYSIFFPDTAASLGRKEQLFAQDMEAIAKPVDLRPDHPQPADALRTPTTHLIRNGIRTLASSCPAPWVNSLEWSRVDGQAFATVALDTSDTRIVASYSHEADIRDDIVNHAADVCRLLRGATDLYTPALPIVMAGVTDAALTAARKAAAVELKAVAGVKDEVAKARKTNAISHNPAAYPGVDTTERRKAAALVPGPGLGLPLPQVASYEGGLREYGGQFAGVQDQGAPAPGPLSVADAVYYTLQWQNRALGPIAGRSRADFNWFAYTTAWLPLPSVVAAANSALRGLGLPAVPLHEIAALCDDMWLDPAVPGRPTCVPAHLLPSIFRRCGQHAVYRVTSELADDGVHPDLADLPHLAAAIEPPGPTTDLTALGPAETIRRGPRGAPLVSLIPRYHTTALVGSSPLIIDIAHTVGGALDALAQTPAFIARFARHFNADHLAAWGSAGASAPTSASTDLAPRTFRDNLRIGAAGRFMLGQSASNAADSATVAAESAASSAAAALALPPWWLLSAVGQHESAFTPAYNLLQRLAYADPDAAVSAASGADVTTNLRPLPHIPRLLVGPTFNARASLSLLAGRHAVRDALAGAAFGVPVWKADQEMAQTANVDAFVRDAGAAQWDALLSRVRTSIVTACNNEVSVFVSLCVCMSACMCVCLSVFLPPLSPSPPSRSVCACPLILLLDCLSHR